MRRAQSGDARVRRLTRIVFDQATPVQIRGQLDGHYVRTAWEQGWSALLNGELLRTAEDAGFDVLLTTDRNIAFQQNLRGRKIAVVALGKGNWPLIKPMVHKVAAAVLEARPSTYTVVDVPASPHRLPDPSRKR